MSRQPTLLTLVPTRADLAALPRRLNEDAQLASMLTMTWLHAAAVLSALALGGDARAEGRATAVAKTPYPIDALSPGTGSNSRILR